MVVTSLVENTSRKELPVEHGLSLHIRLDTGRQILFDMGQSALFTENAGRMGIALNEVELAVLSHGHYDHGGGLSAFLSLNPAAPVYLNRHAFEPHYSLRETGLRYIGLELELQEHERLKACGDLVELDDALTLFADVKADYLVPAGNRLLFGPKKEMRDTFCHEQNLIVREGDKTVLFAGCAHCGIANIMKRAQEISSTPITHVFAGMHLVKSGFSEEEESRFIRSLGEELLRYKGCQYVTMHCTGVPQYEQLKQTMGDAVCYLSCGEELRLS